MRTLSLIGLAVTATFAALPACRASVDIETKTEFVDAERPSRSATKAYAGELIEIINDGTNPALGDTGVYVVGDASGGIITADAVVSAQAFKEDEALAQQSIREAKDTFQITETASGYKIECHHGNGRGSVDQASVGCKKLTVHVPAGSTTTPTKLRVGSGIGGISVTGVTGAIQADANGVGDVDVSISPTKDADIVVTGEDEVVVRLPATFSAKSVVLNVGTEEAPIVVGDFPGMASGKAYPESGATADAANSLNVQSKGILSSDSVTIRKQ